MGWGQKPQQFLVSLTLKLHQSPPVKTSPSIFVFTFDALPFFVIFSLMQLQIDTLVAICLQPSPLLLNMKYNKNKNSEKP